MNKCDNCNVFVYSQHTKCPLCGLKVGESTPNNTMYPLYNTKHNSILRKFFLFLILMSCGISLYVNMFTLDETINLWSIIVSASLISLWILFKTIKTKVLNEGKKILIIYTTLIILLFIIDLCTGFTKWSTNYLVPFMTIGIAIIFTGLALKNKNKFSDYLGYLIVIFFISFVPILSFLVSLSTFGWTSFIAMLYCLLTAIGLIIFADTSFKHEIKKRFHF